MENKQGTINIFPFGVILQERFDIAQKYGLVEDISDIGIWRLTKKCKDNYDEVSFYHYLQGKVATARRRQDKGKDMQIKLLLKL